MSAPPDATRSLYGLLGEFADAEGLLAAARALREAAPGHIEAYSPFPIPGLAECLGSVSDRTPLWMLIGGLLGGMGTFAVEWYSAVFDYPIRVGGRPSDSWQAFLPPAIEMSLLGAALLGVLALLIASALPQVRHPLFAVSAFERASSDRFFLLVRAGNPQFDAPAVHARLASLGALAVLEVPS